MTWWRATAYLGLFIGLTAYYVASEPGSGGSAPATPPPHAFLGVTSASVRTVSVQRGAVTLEAVRDGERWRVERPANVHVPSDLVAALVEQLAELPAVEVVDEHGESAAQFGLEPPEAHVTFMLADGRSVGVALGARNPAQTAAYGRVDGTTRVVLLGLNVLYYENLLTQAARPSNG
ncbi:MAG: DUF4340 domain-containing protein [Deltaproteobacteria bacterium]|nr:DUF4340 domain-containing protein [Deltaproteobacteria bacterium]MBI3389016.1 DUF4340 domain-containing protein [Deltaproteobacteria bacterium]